jgi:4a-hydroxytetrahydrobiopterin dehydratase
MKTSEDKPLSDVDLRQFEEKLSAGWQVIQRQRLERTYKFPNFREALNFTNRVGEVAEKQNHHPDIFLTWGEVRIQISTHESNGLTASDFDLAIKIDGLE